MASNWILEGSVMSREIIEKTFAENGTIEQLSDAQMRQGYDFLGDEPPSFGQFNHIQQQAWKGMQYLLGRSDVHAGSISGKVNKEDGKGLTTNDFSDEYKNTVDSLSSGTVLEPKPIASANLAILTGVYYTSGDVPTAEQYKVDVIVTDTHIIQTATKGTGDLFNRIFAKDSNEFPPFKEVKDYSWVDVTSQIKVVTKSKSSPDFIALRDAAIAHNNVVLTNAIAQAIVEKKGVKCAALKSAIYCNANIDFTGISNIDFAVDIRNLTGTVIVGGFALTADPVNINFKRIVNDTDSALAGAIPANDTFRIEGVKAGVIRVGQTNLLRVHAYGDEGKESKSSNAYFEMYLGGSVRAFRVSDSGSYTKNSVLNVGWCNEFQVYGGRIVDLEIKGTEYMHNNLTFDSNTFEGTLVSIAIKNGSNNRILNPRFENTATAPGIFLDSDSNQNTIIQRWAGSGSSRSMYNVSPPVVDSGVCNMVSTSNATEFKAIELFNISANNIVANDTSCAVLSNKSNTVRGNITNPALLTPHFNQFQAEPNRFIALSDVVPVRRGDAIIFDSKYEGALLRPQIYLYDQNMSLIVEEESSRFGLLTINSKTVNTSTGAWSSSAPLDSNAMRLGASINSAAVKYIQVGVIASVSGYFSHLSATLYTSNYGFGVTKSFVTDVLTMPEIVGAPNKGAPPVGTVIYESNERQQHRCVMNVETFANIAATASSTVTVARSSGVAIGDIVGIMQTNATVLWATVTANDAATNTVTLSKQTTHGLNARVVFVRWRAQYIVAVSSVPDPLQVPAKSRSPVVTVPMAGASLNRHVQAIYGRDLQGLMLQAYVSSSGNVRYFFVNMTDTTVDLAGGSVYLRVSN